MCASIMTEKNERASDSGTHAVVSVKLPQLTIMSYLH